MRPVLFTVAGLNIASYAVFVSLGLLVAYVVRRGEVARLGYEATPGHRWVGLGALAGAAVGAKLGMVLFAADFQALWAQMADLDFTGKTVVGGIGGAYLGVELTKRLVGVRHSTGDAFAVSVPFAQAFGRVGCFLNGCCNGVAAKVPWSVSIAGVDRHPSQLYEAAGDLALAAWLWSRRRRPAPQGELFRLYLIGYAALRFALEPLRDDAVLFAGGLTGVQWVCLATVIGFAGAVSTTARRRRAGT